MMDHLSQTVKEMSDDFVVTFPESSPFSDECSDELSLSRSVSYVCREYLLAVVAIGKPSCSLRTFILYHGHQIAEDDPAYVQLNRQVNNRQVGTWQ